MACTGAEIHTPFSHQGRAVNPPVGDIGFPDQFSIGSVETVQHAVKRPHVHSPVHERRRHRLRVPNEHCTVRVYSNPPLRRARHEV
jgi:hypothetical protein